MTFTITPALVIVTAEDESKVYGAANLAFTAIVDGLKTNDPKNLMEHSIDRARPDGTNNGEDVGEYTPMPS